MKKIYTRINDLPNRIKDSFIIAWAIVGLISTILSVLGWSLGSFSQLSIVGRIAIVIAVLIGMVVIVYLILGSIFKDAISLYINNTAVSVECGDIFNAPEWRVIGVDTHFDTRVDDIIISVGSLHGKLVLDHGDRAEIDYVVECEAQKRGLQKDEDGLYDFPLGTVIKYESSIDQHIYLMAAISKLDKKHKARTNMEEYERMLMNMWKELDGIYASHDIVMPILGMGITRFDGPKDKVLMLS